MPLDDIGAKPRFFAQSVHAAIHHVPSFEIGQAVEKGAYHRHLQPRTIVLGRHILHIDRGRAHAGEDLTDRIVAQ